MVEAAARDPEVPADLTDGLNVEQAAAVRALLGPVLVVAGPGSGKTRVLTHRVAALVRTRLAYPSQVLAVTFTNKAAGEMRERLVSLLGEDDVERMWVTTFHSMCARVLRMEHEAAGLPRAFSILDSGDVRSVLKGVLDAAGLPSDASDVRGFAQEISRFKNGGRVSPDRRLPMVLEAYEAALARLAALDFDDLLLRAARLLREHPEVLGRFRSRFRFVLVDEYQDTNPVQYELVRLLSGEHRNVCVVGDADQSIYGFRSATPEALHAFSADWPDARVIVLEQNYRSTGAIVEACRSLIDVASSPFRPRLFTQNPDGDPVRLVVCDDDRDEAQVVASELARRSVDASAAVLVRTNAQSRQFEEALLRASVPYVVVGALRFYERAEVKDALAYLRLVANPRDAVALARVVSAPRRGLGPKALQEVQDIAQGLSGAEQGSLIAAMRRVTSGRGASAWADLACVLDDVARAAREGGPAAALGQVLSSGLREFTARSGDQAADRVANLEELVSAARMFTDVPDPASPEAVVWSGMSGWDQLEAFLGNVALVAAVDSEGADPHAGLPVQVMTAHASKGKEFDMVFVCGVEEGFYPHTRGNEQAAEDEERRLLFVACSRARGQLTLTRAARRMTFGKAVENPPSRFLADLPSSVRTVVRAVPSSSRMGWAWSDRARGGSAPVQSSSSGPRRMTPRPAPGPRVAEIDAVPGARVRHRVFGDGLVEQSWGEPGDVSVQVRFADGVRVLKVAMAPLELL